VFSPRQASQMIHGVKNQGPFSAGKYSSTVVPELSGMDAIERFGRDNSI